MKKSFTNQPDITEILARLQALRADSQRQWGKMTPHQMMCHLTDSFIGMMGGKAISSQSNFFMRSLGKRVALQTSLPWPHGVKTRPEVDQEIGGTPPLLNERLKQEVYDFEENKNMQLIGSWERSARQTGVVGYVTELVTARVGVLGTTLKSRLQNLTDQQLLELGLAVHSFQKKSDLTAWLKVQTVTPSTPHKRR